jgi:ribosomal RNA-processing protein 12
VCHALTNLIEKNSQLLQMDLDDTEMMQKYHLTEGKLQQNLSLIASFSTNFLSILFNVFSQTTPSYRSPISECIKAFLSVASQEVHPPSLLSKS